MLVRDPSFEITSAPGFGHSSAGFLLARGINKPSYARPDERPDAGVSRPPVRTATRDDTARARVEISPTDAVRRHMAVGQNITVEIVQSTATGRTEHRFCADKHLLIVWEEGGRQEGETSLGDLPRSTLRNLTRKLTFVPAGHTYHDWQQSRTPSRVIYFYVEPAALQGFAEILSGTMTSRPRLLFEDKTLLESALKLKRLVESPELEDQHYFDALGAVLIHELVRLDRGTNRSEPPIKGGLAAWQQRVVTAYIEEHLTEPIALQTLAHLARLSPHYFCRAFKQSLGLPPHRYHGIRRIERAKAMLASPNYSVTEIGMRLGFSETSSFSTAFRKATGLTPTAYHRTLD